MKRFFLMLSALAFVGASCERHEFEGEDGTKQLHQHGGDHGKGHEDSGDKGHH